MALVPGAVQGAEPEGKVEKIDSAVVMTSRAGGSTPVTYSMVSRDELRKSGPLSSLPMSLAMQPSVVAVNEGGTGLGYSKMTVRGSKGSQINVTLNGITLNDAESQEVFWVNIPALGNILSSIQLQRGLGTSAAGPGAFGASINMSTASVSQDPYAFVDLGYGSYSTFSATASAGTGLMKHGLYLDVAYSRGLTDGYIRNAFADVQSAYAALGWMNEKNSLRLIWLFGDQRTGITWNGIDLEQYERDRRYNPAGEYYDSYGNARYYDNETDNYTQNHLQLNYTRQLSDRMLWTTTFNWTRGDGYFETYMAGAGFGNFRFPSELSVKYPGRSDFIVQEALENDYLVLNSDLKYTSERLDITAGVNLSRYDGDHIGEVIWSEILGDSYDYDAHQWYLNNGLKHEVSAFVRTEYRPLAWLTAYADLQYRGIWLDMKGLEYDDIPLDQSHQWHFFNPRAGLSFSWNPRHKAYASAAMGHREPGRADIKYAKTGLKPEKMLDVEIGYSYMTENLSVSANLYFMEYWDMLLETGLLSNVGYAIKENVPRAYRRGLEVAAGWRPLKWLRADANLTLSLNRIKDYTEYVQHVDTYADWASTGRMTPVSYGRTTMLMSPSVVGMFRLEFSPWRGIAASSLKTTTLAIGGKYIGKQYLDNTMTEGRSVPAYFVSDLSLSHRFDLKKGSLSLSAFVNNLFNNMYYADGWCWKNVVEEDGALVDGVGIYPQAPINFSFKVGYSF